MINLYDICRFDIEYNFIVMLLYSKITPKKFSKDRLINFNEFSYNINLIKATLLYNINQ